MKKIIKFISKLFVVFLVLFLIGAVAEQVFLEESLIRLHVVADSNDPRDQEIKLQVRDAILETLEQGMEQLPDMESAKAYLQSKLPELQKIANEVLEAAGEAGNAVVSLAKEKFPTRIYDTFKLPAGVYESLRVTIGDGEGKNWWCVVFPRLCVSATTDGFEDTAAGAGFSSQLTGALTDKPVYKVRFFVMDCIGWVQNWLFSA